jgi:hypothetical protein
MMPDGPISRERQEHQQGANERERGTLAAVILSRLSQKGTLIADGYRLDKKLLFARSPVLDAARVRENRF